MPYSYPTTPGVTYAVECAAEVFVTNPQTGAVAVSGDGSATVYFTATDALYDISDDSAKVQPLFKLAPRLRLTLLQGVAGGWLPKGYTELEYLESSGTQKIDINYQPMEVSGYYTDYENTSSGYYQHVLTSAADGKVLLFTPHYNGMDYNFFAAVAYRDGTRTWNIADLELLSRKKVKFNYLNAHTCVINNHHKFDIPAAPLKEYQKATTCLFMHPASVHQNEGLIGKLFAARITEGKQQVRDLVPVLDENGTPCLFDKVSPQCFYNTGKGTLGYRIKRTGETVALMSLRDPWRVAPSGVYARKVGENELELVADTEETTGEGWEWFANTAEAYAHFGIVPQEEFLTE